MKRLLLLLSFVMMSLSASAQYADLSIKRGQVYAGDELLTETQLLDLYSNVGGVDRTADYLDIARRYKVGKTMNTVGLVTFGVSGITGVASLLGIFINMGDKVKFNLCRASLCASGILFWGGAITSIVGTKKKRKASEDLRNLTLGVQPGGLGLSLNF
jgi:hypothetical protein